MAQSALGRAGSGLANCLWKMAALAGRGKISQILRELITYNHKRFEPFCHIKHGLSISDLIYACMENGNEIRLIRLSIRINITKFWISSIAWNILEKDLEFPMNDGQVQPFEWWPCNIIHKNAQQLSHNQGRRILSPLSQRETHWYKEGTKGNGPCDEHEMRQETALSAVAPILECR